MLSWFSFLNLSWCIHWKEVVKGNYAGVSPSAFVSMLDSIWVLRLRSSIIYGVSRPASVNEIPLGVIRLGRKRITLNNNEHLDFLKIFQYSWLFLTLLDLWLSWKSQGSFWKILDHSGRFYIFLKHSGTFFNLLEPFQNIIKPSKNVRTFLIKKFNF